jgi:hypothetical protein
METIMFLVSWKDMAKGGGHLPLRPFDTREEAIAYRDGCADFIVISSRNELDINDVIKDFAITNANG